jgi:transcriptional regulator with XRE-family HTH domain
LPTYFGVDPAAPHGWAETGARPLPIRDEGAELEPQTIDTQRTERLKALGEYIRYQRNLASISLRELARLARVSDPYLSQIERGLHEPSVRILTSIAGALNLKSDALLTIAAGLSDADPPESSTEAAILSDPLLDAEQRETMLRVYRGLTQNDNSKASDGVAR